jgi:hypothetical protein
MRCEILMNETNINLDLLQKGAVIAYRLPIEELPIHPKKLWKGRVLALYEDRVLVEMLEPGYAGLSEYVYISQIVGLEN